KLVAHHGKPHGVGTIQQLAVFDGMKADVGRNVAGSPAVPAGAMAAFGGVGAGRDHFVCWGTYPGGRAAPSPKKKSSMCLATRSCASFCQGMSRYSLRIIFMRSSQSFHASLDTCSKMRCPSSPGQGAVSRPGSSF